MTFWVVLIFATAVSLKALSAEMLRVAVVNTGIWGAPVGLPTPSDPLGLTFVSQRETFTVWLVVIGLNILALEVVCALFDLARRADRDRLQRR